MGGLTPTAMRQLAAHIERKLGKLEAGYCVEAARRLEEAAADAAVERARCRQVMSEIEAMDAAASENGT